MNRRPAGFEYLLTEPAREDIRALSLFDQMRLPYALDQLLFDPSPCNLIISVNPGTSRIEAAFVVRLRDPAVYFDMLNPYVSAVRRIRLEA